MIHQYVMTWPDYNMDVVLHLKEVKGDSMIFIFLIDGIDMTHWKIKAELYDLNTSIRLANTLAGGNDTQIKLLAGPSAAGHFQIHINAGATSTFQKYGQFEVEITDPDGNSFTIFQQEICFVNERIYWTTPV